jgi:peptidoglycan/xylan/chitin deacetylase (PgdA/CDA1 family)
MPYGAQFFCPTKELTYLKRFLILCSPVLILLSAFAVARPQTQEIAVTIDDLPAHSALPPDETRLDVADKILKALDEAHVPPTYGFVNGAGLNEVPTDGSVLDAWRAQGNPLGNHTWSHMSLNTHTAEQFEADILQNEPVIRDRMAGQDWRWLRYPFLQEGDTPEKRNEVRQFIAKHGYKIAAVTMSFGDYLWNEPYARCSAKNDAQAIHQLEESYLRAADEEVDYEEALSHIVYGHGIPYVLLMHIGAFDARMMPRLFALYQRKGLRFVTLADAEKDPFYASDVDPNLPAGPSGLAEDATSKHIPLPPHPQSVDFLKSLCR